VRELAERAYFFFCLGLGWLLRSARYSTAQIVRENGELHVRKRRLFYAPVLVWLAEPLMKVLDTGVRVLPHEQWVDRERTIYQTLRGTSVRVDSDGTLILPHLSGRTLATILEDPAVADVQRNSAIESAAVALRELHRAGFTHGDAMAENVLVDLEAGTAHWFDFETVHDPRRTQAWRRADDLRALLVTCLIRAAPGKFAVILTLVVTAYGDEEVTRVLAANFSSVIRRPLAFHLAQVGLSFERYRSIARLLSASLSGCGPLR
jgi:hypothetical protein